MGKRLDDDPAPLVYGSIGDPERGNTGKPPAYDSLYGKLKDTRTESSGFLDFFKKLAKILCGTIACTIISMILIGIPIAMVTIGATYLHNCPLQRFIPIYLIVAGCFGIVRTLCCARKGIKKEEEGDDEKDYGSIIDIFLFAWLICGSVWVYKSYGDVNYEDSTNSDYCHPTVYKFAFGIITTYWSLMGLLICCGICMCCFAAAGSS